MKLLSSKDMMTNIIVVLSFQHKNYNRNEMKNEMITKLSSTFYYNLYSKSSH